MKITYYIPLFILTFAILISLSCYEDCNRYLNISAPYLQEDDNGYYHMEFLDSEIQTSTTLKAGIGGHYNLTGYMAVDDSEGLVSWISNRETMIDGNLTNLLNDNIYTDEGIAHTDLRVLDNFIGDTIKIYAEYTDECNDNHADSLEVVIDVETQE